MDRVSIVHENFLRRVAAEDFPVGETDVAALDAGEALGLYRAQVLSRALDLQSRVMQKAGQGFYTIGSSGHEGMAALGHALRVDDIAFLHYRDAAFQIARAAKAGQPEMMRDMLLSFACSVEDPTSGGRHKVLGSRSLMIPPQTSTIASHLPKAVGAAHAITLARRNRPEHAILARDGIAMCSFGDASLNHSTAQGAINAAGWTAVQGIPLPLLFVCEDNGIGISTKTPTGWVKATMSARPGVKYFEADGLDIFAAAQAAQQAVDWVRTHRKPAFLHLRTVRLYGHAGPDVVTSYLPRSEVEADEAHDPLLYSARGLVASGAATAAQALALYTDTLEEVAQAAQEMVDTPRLQNAAEVMASLIPPRREVASGNGPSVERRAEVFGSDMAQIDQPQPMSRLINWALHDLMLEYPETLLMGEDVGRKGGNYGVTQKLHSRFGPARVIDTLLDEQSILGLAIGLAHNGFIPMPEIQFLAYLHNAEDQLRGEAATLPFFSNGQWSNPMVVRISALGYQKGFGGHFHNDNSLAVLRDIPGLIIACPSTGDDAALMLRECHRLAREEQRVVIFVEPIALYPMRDLLEVGDGGWMRSYPAPDQRIASDSVGVHGDGDDLAIVTYGNGHYLSRQAQHDLSALGVAARVIDLRWLAPMPEDALLEAIGSRPVLIVDECRRTGGQAEALMAVVAEAGVKQFARLTAEDSFIATGPAYGATLPSRSGIVAAAQALLAQKTD
ncbi:thiamine pyrophosphate-dependent enzyme [Sulfitobacter geojensis]|uniref:2-oxoglutarate dehydrogenase E1 component n=1 Tax=Sulfitobacter geojensis TaxID=1342299 RepID=A0AAE3B7E2_9RHOB|nr:thiamine pyrophosphate-dependent enzyme [Sulfitobacter geojensis]MBM1690124.1 MFS transporter [Sulfitobacter geojensis]MBM1694190.1 MFS transporter [Sulfitobacter geojensis]MBM1706356.1 MFS transporter [Sulfitobacter geojensis]MBM1710414.1 MFS transporter [Sulfitobacter geojensis]MBM1714480.1 MFS transporter [Sulfitobacter geojensis]